MLMLEGFFRGLFGLLQTRRKWSAEPLHSGQLRGMIQPVQPGCPVTIRINMRVSDCTGAPRQWMLNIYQLRTLPACCGNTWQDFVTGVTCSMTRKSKDSSRSLIAHYYAGIVRWSPFLMPYKGLETDNMVNCFEWDPTLAVILLASSAALSPTNGNAGLVKRRPLFSWQP